MLIQCDHYKENGRSRLWRWDTSDGTRHYICNLCRKEFSDETVPRHLVPESIFEVGGPAKIEHKRVAVRELYEQYRDYASGFIEETTIYRTLYLEAKRQAKFYQGKAAEFKALLRLGEKNA